MNDRKSETESLRRHLNNQYWVLASDCLKIETTLRNEMKAKDDVHARVEAELGNLTESLTAAHEQLAKVRAETIEQCAKVCEETSKLLFADQSLDSERSLGAEICVGHIRALQEKAK